jgi:hypothetical protein
MGPTKIFFACPLEQNDGEMIDFLLCHGFRNWIHKRFYLVPFINSHHFSPLLSFRLSCRLNLLIHHQATAPLPPKTPTPWETYTEWCRNGLGARVSTKLEVRDLGEHGERGVFAVEPIGSGEALVEVPFESLLTVASGLSCPPDLALRASALCTVLGQLSREDDALALRLLFEKHENGSRSKFAGHVAVLPKSYPLGLVEWPEAELEALLAGSGMKVKAEVWRAQVERDFDALKKLVVVAAAAAAGGGSSSSSSPCDGVQQQQTLEDCFPWFTLANYKWALASIWTRCVSVKCTTKTTSGGEQQQEVVYKALSPYFDLFNHSFASKTVHGLASASEWTKTGAALTVTTGQTWASGEEVCLNYGAESNGRLLLIYGFCAEGEGNSNGGSGGGGKEEEEVKRGTADNEYDEVELVAPLPPGVVGYAAKAAALRTGLGLPSPPSSGEGNGGGDDDEVATLASLSFLLKANDPLPERLLSALRVQRASEAELPHLDKAFSAAVGTTATGEGGCGDGGAGSGAGRDTGSAGGGSGAGAGVGNGEPISPENEARVLEALKGALSSMLHAYPTTAEEDARWLRECEKPTMTAGVEAEEAVLLAFHRRRMATILRLGEKRILMSSLECVAQRQAAAATAAS